VRALGTAAPGHYNPAVIIRQIFISPGHNFFGHHGREPDDFPLQAVDRVECIAGHGLRGDRFYGYKNDYKGQITFFAQETFDALRAAFPTVDKSAGVLRRNVIVADADLNSLIGETFAVQGVRFVGTGPCEPCHWMNRAFAPGTEDWLRNRGGLRARILSDGWIETIADSVAATAT
jgi:hypothetical protein